MGTHPDLGPKLDQSTMDCIGAKMGLDATIPVDAEPLRFTKISVPCQDELDTVALTRDATEDWAGSISPVDS